jgi:hypothetical protein
MPQIKMKTSHLLKNLILSLMKIMKRAKKKRLLQLKFNKSLHMMLTRQSRRAMRMMVLRRTRTFRRKTPRSLQV